MALNDKLRGHDIVVWELKGRDESGAPVYEDPVDIKGRWDASTGTAYDEDGEEITYSHAVFLAREYRGGTKLMRGTTNDLSSPQPPPEDAIPIKAFDVFDNFRYTETFYLAFL